MTVFAPALFAFLLWLAVTWTVEPASLAIGALIALVTGITLRRTSLAESRLLLAPVRLFWALLYVPVLFAYVVRANLDVAYRVLHPAMPIHPGIVKVKTDLKTRAGITALANSITLTPGTITIRMEDDVFYVHSLNRKTAAGLPGEMEARIARVFGED